MKRNKAYRKMRAKKARASQLTYKLILFKSICSLAITGADLEYLAIFKLHAECVKYFEVFCFHGKM